MASHEILTVMILYMNIILTLLFPNIVLADNGIYYVDAQGNYHIDSDLQSGMETLANRDSGLIQTGLVILDGLAIVFNMIVALAKIMFASMILLYQLPTIMMLVLGIPLSVMYFIAIGGWIKS